MNREHIIEEVTDYVVTAGRRHSAGEPEVHRVNSDQPGMPVTEVRFDRGLVTVRLCNATPRHEPGIVGGTVHGLCVRWHAAPGKGWVGAALALSAADHMRRLNDGTA